jgi:FAD/FMN-containing dehydrogenase
METEEEKKDELWKIRDAASSVLLHGEGGLRPLPIIEDGIVPPERFSEFLSGLYVLFDKHGIRSSVWGDAGDANIHTRPFLDLGQVGDRQKAFRLAEEYYNLVISLGGSTSGENGDGRVRGPYLKQQYGEDLYALFQKVKQIFDPYNMLNPGVKVNVSLEDIKPLLRNEYSQDFVQHLPRG